MLDLLPVAQRPSHCGPSSLKIVLAYYCIQASEKEIGRLAGTTRSKGTSAKGLLKAARTFGLKGFVKDFADFKDLQSYVKKKIPVIVNWFSGIEGHYSVVAGLDRDNICLQDPYLGRLRALRWKTFRKVWFDFPSEGLHRKEDIWIRRVIVFFPIQRKKR